MFSQHAAVWCCPTKNRLLKASVWPVARYGSGGWTFYHKESQRHESMHLRRPLREILSELWMSKRTKEWFSKEKWKGAHLLQ